MFRLRERGTTVRTELLVGTTTFITMAYIIVMKVVAGRWRELSAGVVVLGVMCLFCVLFGLRH